MYTLSVEHPIVDYETWKAAFDRDPARREQSGVRRYRVFRPEDDPKYIVIELDFESTSEAEAFLVSLERVWSVAELSPGLARDLGAANLRVKARILQEMASSGY